MSAAVLRLGLVLFFSYLVGFVVFFPGKWGAAWVRAGVPVAVQWQALELDWRGARGKMVVVPGPEGKSRLVLTDVQVEPRFLPLLWGSPTVAYRLVFAGGHVAGTVQWSAAALRVQWRMQLDDFSKLPVISAVLVPVTGSGVGEGELVLDWASWAWRTGSWGFKGKEMTSLGVVLDTFNVKGELAEGNRLEMHLSGKGNVAVSGQVTLARAQALLESSLSGRVQIQPLDGRLQGVVGAALGGKPATLAVGGSLGQPSWNMQ